MKRLLRKILGRASLFYKTLNTVLCDTEAIINSRPLTYISEDPDDLKPLSPSVFLQEISEVRMRDCDMFYQTKLDKKPKCKQKIFENLRKRFRDEYLRQLLFKKRKREIRKVQIGNIVLIGDDTHKRMFWPLARVTDAIPGRDGQERVFILKMKNGLLKRPIQQIYPLEISFEKPEQVVHLRDNSQCNLKSEDVELSDKTKSKEIVTTTISGRTVQKPDRLGY
ncbi:uncharacterized protein [Cardiocondyla obscurior]|uniref:uncharacterized protein n=1 Tax=Cardiocondyla obscurior TaxID=286306 RepID=UPI0039656BFA